MSKFEYDQFGNVKKIQDPRMVASGNFASVTYNTYDDPLTEKNAINATTTYVRDGIVGSVTQVKNALNQVQGTYTYNTDGSLATASSEGVTTSLTYNALGELTNVSTPDGSVTVQYGAGHTIGKPIQLTDNRNRITTFDYDDWGRLIGTTRSDGATSTTNINVLGWVMSTIDVEGRLTAVTRDAIGRVLTETNPRGDQESYAYDERDRLVLVTNGRGKVTTYTYSPRSEVTKVEFPDAQYEAYKFDGNGNMSRKINGLGQATFYEHDASDNLVEVDYSTLPTTMFTYDIAGRQTAMYDSTGTSTWSYDSDDRLTQLSTPQGVMTYLYDQWGRRTSMTEGTAVTNYTYTTDRLTRIVKSVDGVDTTIGYDNYGRVNAKSDGATASQFGYDALDRLNSIVHRKSSDSSILQQESYVYSPAGNLQTKTVGGVTTTYAYDLADQLLGESRPGYTCLYTYDENGNRKTKQLNGITETYTYDDADKLLYRQVGGVYTNYTYDAAGRTTSISSGGSVRTFNWNEDDRLVSLARTGQPTTSYVYNGFGTRVSKANSNGSRAYKRDGAHVTAGVLSDSVSTMVPGISERSGGTTRHQLADYLGSVKKLTSAGSVTDSMEYDAFGAAVSRTGRTNTQAGFAGSLGYQTDAESEYQLLGHRYYDPAIGRFLTRDPIRDGRNWYAYCENGPLRAVDPDGLQIRQTSVHTPQGVRWLVEQAIEEAAEQALEFAISQVTSGIYIIEKDGKWYVGQSGDLRTRLQSHVSRFGMENVERAKIIQPPAKLKGKTDRETREFWEKATLDHLRLDKGFEVHNIREPVGPKRKSTFLDAMIDLLKRIF